MKCPNCGCEMAEGHLYCEKCGMEIRIVPDFEPEIENSITETLSTVAEEIEENNLLRKSGHAGDGQGTEHPGSSGKQKTRGRGNKKEKEILTKEQKRNWLILWLATFSAIALAAAFVTISVYHRFSVTYQIEQARECADIQDYKKAIEYLERARMLSEDAFDISMMESNYYYQMGEDQKAVDILIRQVNSGQLKYEEVERAYENIVAIYSEDARYEDINSLLVSCKYDEIINQFQQYMAMDPEFGYESGNYEEVLPLKISANTAGKIYYTTDGTNPDANSEVYTAPIFLESGEYQVAAVFVNDYGIKSNIVRKWYVIDLMEPDPPELYLSSGEYHVPTMITVGAPESGTVYYTVDGAKPGKDSLKYTQPISMPLGRSNFRFVTISEEGVPSEIVSRSFDLTLETDVTVDVAIANVVQALFDQRVLLDLRGHSLEIQGKYVFKYDTIVEIPDLGYYYVLKEYIEDLNGNQTLTERLYAVEVYTGVPNRLTYDENGNMGLIPLQ